MSEIGPIK
jgi:transcriptional regulator with XRE-family HTH domain